MDIQVIEPEHFKSIAWSGGLSREIMIFPSDAEYGPRNFLYRVSTAVVESRESIFTDLPNYNRFIIPLSGELNLSINHEHHHLAPFSVLAFDGAAKTLSQSEPNLTDLNLMVKKGFSAEVQVVRFEEKMEMNLENDQLFVRIQLQEDGSFECILDAIYKPMGLIPPSPLLAKNQLAIIMTLPQNPHGPDLDELSLSMF